MKIKHTNVTNEIIIKRKRPKFEQIQQTLKNNIKEILTNKSIDN